MKLRIEIEINQYNIADFLAYYQAVYGKHPDADSRGPHPTYFKAMRKDLQLALEERMEHWDETERMTNEP